MAKFKLSSKYQPKGDQPQAIAQLTDGLKQGLKEQTLLGVTGSGKTFTMANLIQNSQKPTLVLSHNKTLAAQLYNEFRNFFPENAVHYFVSYFDYYQPEAYIPRSDTYIEKDSQINEEIDRLRHAATDALLSRRDVIIVASVSCIYGIGSVEDYNGLSIHVKRGERRIRDKFLRHLTDIQYQRNDIDFHRSTFRVRGDVVDVFPAGEELAYRIEFFGDEVDRITKIDPLTGEILANLDEYKIFPGSHYVTPFDKLKVAMGQIENELDQRLKYFNQHGMLLEAQRLQQRTRFDLEMLEETGFVKGIENYSRYLTNREEGEQPATLLDYFPDDFLMLVDESHMTMPQVRGMYNGDRARKEVLVEHGFRLPSALDNRPLTFSEFEKHVNQMVYVSATPADYELSRSPEPAQQVIRPTGLLDPPIEVRPVDGQVDDLIAEIRDTIAKRQRVLVTTLTKRMAEDLTEYLQELNIKVTYLHSDIDTLERTDILRDLRLGTYDVVVGINLLREGLDLPEVSLVAILDADKEGFLRSEQALIQTIGRAARHVEGHVIMYANNVTGSMQRAIDETNRRRKIQEAYNNKHGITPTGIAKAVEKGMRPELPEEATRVKLDLKKIPKDEYGHIIRYNTAMRSIILVAHNLRSTHNVGSLLRTADGLGVEHVFLTGYTPYPLSQDDIRLPHLAHKIDAQIHKTALGAELTQAWTQLEDVAQLITDLRDQGYTVAAVEQTATAVSLPNFNPPDKLALIVGREVEGIEPAVLELTQSQLFIPMFGQKESFNVVQAAAMALYHCRFA